MKYRQWFLLALSPLLLVVALVGVRSFGGSPDVAAANGAKIEIDMVKDGSDWCNPVNNAATHTVSANPLDVYEVAICLTNAEAPPASFNIELLYNDLWNSCTDVANAGTGLDDNPDANAGTTYWDTVGHSLGTVGWDCSAGGTNYPVCDTNTAERGAGKGVAFLTCGAPSADPGDLTLPVGASVSSPIAVVTLKAVGAGVDNLAFGIVKVADYDVETIMACPADGANCVPAADTKEGEPAEPTATPTSTMTPAATNTPCGPGGCPTSTVTPRAWTKTPTPAPTDTPAPSEPGGPGEPAPPPPPPPPTGGTMPQVVPPGTGTGSGGGDWTTSLMWTLAGAGALSVFLGGLYLRRARNR